MYHHRHFKNCNRFCTVQDFKRAVGLDAKSLSDLILHTLQSYGLDVKACLIGQGYDGTSVTRGANKGAD